MELNTFFDLLHRYLMRFAIFNFFNEKVFTQKDVQPTEAVKKALNLTDKSIMEMYSFLNSFLVRNY